MISLLSKIRANSKLKRILCICGCLLVFANLLCVSAFAAPAADTVSEPTPAEAAQEVFNTMHGTFNFTNILSIIGVALGAALAIFIGWWAIRKVSKMVMNAFSKGKVSV